MKQSFHARLVNNPFEDPSLYIRLLREGRALLFDAGFTSNLSVRDILKISDVFISHTHVDHFIGFDSLLRLHLKSHCPLRLYGPEGFASNIEGKLRSYSWNLIGDYPIIIEAMEVNGKEMVKTVFRAVDSFKREEICTIAFEGVLLKDSFFKVSTAVLDHQIPCLAFSLEEDYHINIDKSRLTKLGLPVGQWLGDLKNAIRKNQTDSVFNVNDKMLPFAELKDIASITKGQKITYVADALGSDENIKKIAALAKGSDTLYIEAYFLDEDKDRAKERYHLTAKEAGQIAREAGVGKLVVFHFSPKYTTTPEAIVKEAEKEFMNE